MKTQKLAYSIKEVLQLIGISRNTFYELIRKGKIRSYTVGSRRFVSHQAILDFQQANEEIAPDLQPRRKRKNSSSHVA